MSRLPSWKTARIWIERMAKGERFNAPYLAVLPVDRLLADDLLHPVET